MRLGLHNNQLTGSIPPALGNLSHLHTLTLNTNQLTGSIPTQLGNLSNLHTLTLDGNQLTGPIPKELGTLSRLRRLNMAGNQLSGCIPNAWRSVSENDLSDIGLPFCLCTNSNALPDPEEPGLDADCTTLLEAKDTLQGTATLNWITTTRITAWDGITVSNSRVTELFLRNKRLTGRIPTQLGNLSQLTDLNLRGNRLTGRILSQLGNLSQLQTLNLRGNRLTGPIPPALANLSHLTQLHLRNNQLCGDIPQALLDLPNLDLDLRGSTLPTCIGTSAINDNTGTETSFTEILYLPIIHR